MPPKNAIPGKLRGVAPISSSGVDLQFSSILNAQNDGRNGPSKREGPVRPWIAQLAVIITQTCFVVGSVYLKSSLQLVDTSKGEVFHPVVYAFLREIIAGPILFTMAWLSGGALTPARQDIWRVAGLGSCLFLSQLLYIMGIELSGVVVATCIQPAIPVFTVLFGVVMGMETANPQKLTGILFAVVGAICMVLGGVSSHSVEDGEQISEAAALAASNMVMGNICLLVNTMAMSMYYIQSKKLVSKYTPIQIASWAYIVGASLMGVAALTFTTAPDWNYPQALFMPLVYWIFICSVGGYYTVAWAMKYLPASQVAAFQCLQPFLGSILAFLVLNERLSKWDVGAVGVVAGLLLVSLDRKDMQVGHLMKRVKHLIRNKSALLNSSSSGGGGTGSGIV